MGDESHNRGLAGTSLLFKTLAPAPAAEGIPRSTVVTTIARKGVDVGIRVRGLGPAWFAALAARPFSGAGAPPGVPPANGLVSFWMAPAG